MYNCQISEIPTVMDGGLAALLLLLRCLRTGRFKQVDLRTSAFVGTFILQLACSLLRTCWPGFVTAVRSIRGCGQWL